MNPQKPLRRPGKRVEVLRRRVLEHFELTNSLPKEFPQEDIFIHAANVLLGLKSRVVDWKKLNPSINYLRRLLTKMDYNNSRLAKTVKSTTRLRADYKIPQIAEANLLKRKTGRDTLAKLLEEIEKRRSEQ